MSSDHHHIIPPTYLPIVGSVAVFCTLFGFLSWIHNQTYWLEVLSVGLALLMIMMIAWFWVVIKENLTIFRGDPVIDRSFRYGMAWFIFTEVALFSAFFGVLFYVRHIVLTILGGVPGNEATHYMLWPEFSGMWPVLQTPDPSQFLGPKQAMGPWGIPAINTVLLLTSGVTITLAHWRIIDEKHLEAGFWQLCTILLGMAFLYFQAHEYIEAYTEYGLRFDAGIYGNIFFILTGLHGFHVTIGTIMLMVILARILLKHFDAHNHFAFEAVAWYWHMVDVVWLALFVVVYWL